MTPPSKREAFPAYRHAKAPSPRGLARQRRDWGSVAASFFIAIPPEMCHNRKKDNRGERTGWLIGRRCATTAPENTMSCGTHRPSITRRNRREKSAEVCTKFLQKNYTFHQKAARIVNSSGERLEKNRNPVYNESKVSRIMRQKSTELRDPVNAAKKEGRSTL